MAHGEDLLACLAPVGGIRPLAAPNLRALLEHPLTAGLNLDDPKTTELRRQIIASKPFLRAIYDEWYAMLSKEVPDGPGAVLELGSGAGYCEKFIPKLITSEINACRGVQIAADAQRLPFDAGSLRAIVFVNVLHHLPEVRGFFREALRCLRTGGRIAMIEPWVTLWSTEVYTRLHHEPFTPEAKDWGFASEGPLSGANGALPWIVFERDRPIFEMEFPGLAIEQIKPFLPLRYLLSGGVGMRSLMPGFLHSFWAGVERLLSPFNRRLGMFALVVLRRK
jgi:SAM-dependent methyltransferase